MISRRKVLELALFSPVVAALARSAHSESLQSSLFVAPSHVVPSIEGVDVSRVKVERRWRGDVCKSRLVNHGPEAVMIKDVVLFDLQLSLPSTTRLYGEGFQMLSQTGGTLGQPSDLG